MPERREDVDPGVAVVAKSTSKVRAARLAVEPREDALERASGKRQEGGDHTVGLGIKRERLIESGVNPVCCVRPERGGQPEAPAVVEGAEGLGKRTVGRGVVVSVVTAEGDLSEAPDGGKEVPWEA